MCCLWHSHSTLSVVQERAGAGRRYRRHTTGKQRVFARLAADSECLHSHWWMDLFDSVTLSNEALSAMVFAQEVCNKDSFTCGTDWLTDFIHLVTAACKNGYKEIKWCAHLKKNEWWLLQIDGATEEHAGSYLCSISNVLEERWTEAVEVNIGMSPLLSSSKIYKWNHRSGAKKERKKKNVFPLYVFHSTC